MDAFEECLAALDEGVGSNQELLQSLTVCPVCYSLTMDLIPCTLLFQELLEEVTDADFLLPKHLKRLALHLVDACTTYADKNFRKIIDALIICLAGYHDGKILQFIATVIAGK